MSPRRVERSDFDLALREFARRYERAGEAERAWLMAAVEAAHTPSGADCGFTAGWADLSGRLTVVHVVPGPELLDLLLPPGVVEDWLLHLVRA